MALRKRLTWLRRNKFFETTPLFGFSLIHSAKNKYEVALWYIVIFVCATLTIKNLVSLIAQYNSGETVTSMEIGRSQLALFPNMTYCVQMRLPEVNPEFMTDSSKNLPLLANVPSLKDEVTAALQNFTDKEDILRKPWNYILLPLLFRYFTSMRLLEVQPGFLAPGASSTASGTVLLTFLKNSQYHVTISHAIFSILNHTRNLGVDDFKLFERFSQELVAFSEFEAKYSERTMVSAENWVLKPKIKAVFFKLSRTVIHGFCLDFEPLERMSSKHKKPQHVQSRLDFTISCETRDKILQKNYGFNMDQLANALNIGGKYSEENLEKLDVILGDEYGAKEFLDYPALTAEISNTVRAHVTTTALYQSIVNCSPSQTKEQCIIQCKSDIISKYCNCSPLLLLKTTIDRNSTKEMCRLENYLHCLKPSLIEEYNECIGDCASACFNVKYSLTPHRIRTYGNYVKAKVYIYRHESEYPIFMESYAQSLESFFGELGGILGFYLGASILAFLHILIFCVKLVASKRDQSTDEGRREETENLELQNADRRKGSRNFEFFDEDNKLLSNDLVQRVTNIENVIKEKFNT